MASSRQQSAGLKSATSLLPSTAVRHVGTTTPVYATSEIAMRITALDQASMSATRQIKHSKMVHFRWPSADQVLLGPRIYSDRPVQAQRRTMSNFHNGKAALAFIIAVSAKSLVQPFAVSTIPSNIFDDMILPGVLDVCITPVGDPAFAQKATMVY